MQDETLKRLPTHVGPYRFVNHLGSGSFAQVYRAVNDTNGEQVAVKAIIGKKLNAKLRENLECEIRILKDFKHPNIVGLYGIDKTSSKGEFIFLVMEFCDGGDVHQYLQKNGRLDEYVVHIFMNDLANGLKFMWSKKYIHRDLKPQNLLLKSSLHSSVPTLKIADFGFARHLEEATMAETTCGSPLYMAPEILRLQKYGANADLWSVGAIMFEMLTKRPPFNGSGRRSLLTNIEKGQLNLPKSVTLSPRAIELLTGLLCVKPTERMSFDEFLNAPFLKVTPERSGSIKDTKVSSKDLSVEIPVEKHVKHQVNETGDGSLDSLELDMSNLTNVSQNESLHLNMNMLSSSVIQNSSKSNSLNNSKINSLTKFESDDDFVVVAESSLSNVDTHSKNYEIYDYINKQNRKHSTGRSFSNHSRNDSHDNLSILDNHITPSFGNMNMPDGMALAKKTMHAWTEQQSNTASAAGQLWENLWKRGLALAHLADARMAMIHNKVSLSNSWSLDAGLNTGETVCQAIAMSFALYARALDLLQKALDCIGVSDESRSFLWSSLHAVADRADSCRAQTRFTYRAAESKSKGAAIKIGSVECVMYAAAKLMGQRATALEELHRMDCEMLAGFKDNVKDDDMPHADKDGVSTTGKETEANCSVSSNDAEAASLSTEKLGAKPEVDAQANGTDDNDGTSLQKAKSVESAACEDGKEKNTSEGTDMVKVRNNGMLKQAQNLYFHSMYLLQDLLRPEMGTPLSKNDLEGIEEIYNAITQRVSDLSHELDEGEKK